MSKTGKTGSKIAKKVLQRRIARLLIAGYSLRQISFRVNRSIHRVRGLINKPEFEEIAREVEREIYSHIDIQMAGLIKKSISRLHWLMEKKHGSETVLQAVDRVFRIDKERHISTQKLLEQHDHYAQLDELDEQGNKIRELHDQDRLSEDELKTGMELLQQLREAKRDLERKSVIEVNPKEIS